ncbi:hypothetical protein KC19_VG284700 [Ceratodon purpureus]|uniref:Uncharacterized protein n=1 Tax=Ceratodon purpureus TaxID=3225 RepID=A0A8T0HUI6_CERPU|nr:hypothetical protein KC19_VG284700 [Ceratodon purpureus]
MIQGYLGLQTNFLCVGCRSIPVTRWTLADRDKGRILILDRRCSLTLQPVLRQHSAMIRMPSHNRR